MMGWGPPQAHKGKPPRDALTLGGVCSSCVFWGRAFKNKGVQPLLGAVVSYLPSPLDIQDAQGAGWGCRVRYLRALPYASGGLP